MIDALYVLQNAWRYDGRQDWHRASWLAALWASQTGKRLKEMVPEDISFEVCNASPLVGDHSRSRFAADALHVGSEIKRYSPQLLVLCGEVAASLADAFALPILIAPHPAWRLLSKKATALIASEVRASLDALALPSEVAL